MKRVFPEALNGRAADRRALPRSSKPVLEMRIDGHVFAPEDWSLSGCRITDYDGHLRPGQLANVELFLRGCRDGDGLSVIATAMRYEPDNERRLALRFDVLDAWAEVGRGTNAGETSIQ